MGSFIIHKSGGGGAVCLLDIIVIKFKILHIFDTDSFCIYSTTILILLEYFTDMISQFGVTICACADNVQCFAEMLVFFPPSFLCGGNIGRTVIKCPNHTQFVDKWVVGASILPG